MSLFNKFEMFDVCTYRFCFIFGSLCSGVCFTTRVLEKLASQCCEACLTLAVLQTVLEKLASHLLCCTLFFEQASLILAVLEALFRTRNFVCFDIKKRLANNFINGLNTSDIDR